MTKQEAINTIRNIADVVDYNVRLLLLEACDVLETAEADYVSKTVLVFEGEEHELKKQHAEDASRCRAGTCNCFSPAME